MKRIAQLFVLFLLFLTCTTKMAVPAYADDTTTNWVDAGYPESLKAASENNDVNSAAHISNVNTNNYSDLVRRILGPVPGITVTTADLNTPYAQNMRKQSVVTGIAQNIAMMYLSPPASTYAFIQDMGQSLGFMPKTAYAQGVGFSGLSPILPIWKAFRNIAYFALALFMMVMGFMIMFRKKIDPKTVMTVQNSLPKVVITLLLITFSYAIVGLCIDLMYVLIAIIGSVFQSTGMIPQLRLSDYLNGNLWGSVMNTINVWELPWKIIGVSNPGTMIAGDTIGTIGGIIFGVLLMPVNAILGIAAIIVSASSVLVTLLIGLAILLLFIRLFIFFLSTYIKIILALVFSPIQLLMEVVPGTNAFSSWFRGLIANLLIFPVATVIFMLASVFINLSNSTTQSIWAPPFTGLVNNSTSLGSLIALGLLFTIPSIGKSITDLLKAKPLVQGGGLGGVAGTFAGPTQIGMQLFQFWTSHNQMQQMQKIVGAGKKE